MRLAPAPLRTVAALCIALVAAAHQPAMAADAGSPLPAGALTAAQHFALVRPAAPAAQPATTARTATAVDANAPTLRSLSAALFVDATADIPQLLVNVKATDDASGAYYLTVEATGPNGQKKYGNLGPQFPVPTLAGTLALRFGPHDAPGLWQVTAVEVGDGAGNFHDYDAQQLAALGNTRFWVQNSFAKYLDNTAPVLQSATILTPSVSLAGGNSITVGAQVVATDAGNPAPTGVQLAELVFCSLADNNCFSMVQADSVEGRRSTTLMPAVGVAGPGYAPGDYLLYYVHLTDWAGNESFVVGTEFGGSTDFSRLMAAGHKITLLP
ncbi:MAG: hypothetical protein ACJ8IK_12290 [Burkholderiaceae bacterium]|jgi:hypothetical protein